MKLVLFFLATLSLLSSIIATPIDSNSHLNPSLFARVLPEEQRPNTHPDAEPVEEPEPKTLPEPIAAPGTRISLEDIKTAIRNLPKQPWVRRWVKNMETSIDALKRLVGIRPGYRGSAEVLFVTDEFGMPTLDPMVLTARQISQLKEVNRPGVTRYVLEGKFETIEKNPKTGERSGVYEYTEIYVSPYRAISTILEAMLARRQADAQDLENGNVAHKRSTVLEELGGQPGSSQDPAAVFQQYLEMLYTVQASIGAVIAPVLNNVTSESNSTLVHQMALSIYYDLTGSTTVLVGPFNYGISFLGNGSDMTGQGGKNTALNATAEVSTMIEKIYVSMWAQALKAANSTGLYEQQLYLAECLYTNDTSVFPADFTTVRKSANITSASE